jgi:hypothetical protein
MTERALVRSLLAFAVVVVIAFAIVLVTRDPTQEAQLWVEVGKGLIQVLVIVVLGTLLKLIADDYQARRLRAEQRQQFRVDKYRRLVTAINVIRKAPILIEANHSVKTWSEQMLAIIDVGFELRVIKHEIVASSSTADPPFPTQSEQEIVKQLEEMGRYIDQVAEDFQENKKSLSEQQLHAEANELSADERDDRQRKIWEAILQVRSVADLINPDARRSDKKPSWAKYQLAHEEALKLMIQASLGSPTEPSLQPRVT